MYQVIARKYRPQAFAELIGQEHVRTTLENAIAQRRIAHGYIFSGQRGTGKTTVARILARCLNCINGPTAEPCGVCASCLEIAAGNSPDVIEIDAASNRGINEMRELRENVRYRPARDRYKVFIVDEAHQITSEAFNALLKTLEEPPEWAVFILCTTEVHKIPTTIASRCQQFSFRSVDFAEVVKRMEEICAKEGIETTPEVLSVLAQAGEGSVRDSLSALDQAIACCGSKLDAVEVRGMLGMFSLDSLGEVTAALTAEDSRRMLDLVLELERNGRSLQHFCRELARYFRNLLVAKVAGANTKLIAASAHEQERLAEIAKGFSEDDLTRYLQLTLDLFKDLQFSLQPRLHLEIGLLRLIQAGKLVSIEEAIADLGGGGSTPAPNRKPSSSPPIAKSQPPIAKSEPAPANSSTGPWKDRLYAAATELGMPTTADAVEHSEVQESNGKLLFVTHEDYRLLMNEKDILKIVQKVAGRPMRFEITFGTPQAQATPVEKKIDDVSERALADPVVRRFQEVFPDAQVRTVRNLKG
ncbi:MAG: DNA polymerase III subunit gamma/tau [Bryobacteraceae bacterium]